MKRAEGLREFLDARCLDRGWKPFLVFRGGCWSYQELALITDGAAAAFAREGFRRGDRVALLMPNGPDLIFSWLALAKLGVVTAPIHPQFTAGEVGRALSFLEPKALLLDPALQDRVSSPIQGCRVIGSELRQILECRDTLTGLPAPSADDPAEILMTSGTTGRPKGVIQSHRTSIITGEAFATWLGLRTRDRLFTCLPLSHVNARAYSTMGALAAGASLAVEERFSVTRFWGWMTECGATQVNAIGAMLHLLLRAPPSDAERSHKLRLVYSAPALGDEAHLAFEKRFGVRVVIGYGLSESTFGFIHPLSGERKLSSMGKPRTHPDSGYRSEVKLMAEGKQVAPGETGEIWLRNPALFSGYYRDETATREALTPDGWLRTGDLATCDEEDWYTFISRAKEVIRRRGENIAPAEVEAALMSHPAVKEAAVIGCASPLGEEEVVCFVVFEAGSEVPVKELAAFAALRLASFKVPSIWRVADDLPRTSTQRVAKHLLTRDSGSPL